MQETHIAFSDDSAHKDGRFNSLALVTLEKANYSYHSNALQGLLIDSGIRSEFKWSKVRTVKYRFAAKKIINFVFENNKKLRIDTIVWDIEDSRHKNIIGRDDSENLVRMYYHLISSTLSQRWVTDDVWWSWYPDEQSSVDWDTLRDCVNNKKHHCVRDLFSINPKFERVKLISIEPSKSEKYSLIQVADLFAGMAAFSKGHYEKFIAWEKQNSNQLSFFTEKKVKFSNMEKERFVIMKYFNTECKARKMKIAFDSSHGFESHDPDKFINFWLYKPQSKLDKAPKKRTL